MGFKLLTWEDISKSVFNLVVWNAGDIIGGLGHPIDRLHRRGI